MSRALTWSSDLPLLTPLEWALWVRSVQPFLTRTDPVTILAGVLWAFGHRDPRDLDLPQMESVFERLTETERARLTADVRN